MKSRKSWNLPTRPATLLAAGILFFGRTGATEPGQPGVTQTAAESASAIKILSETTLPPGLAKAADVRWAGDRSVYLALRDQGVVEQYFGPLLTPTRTIVPGRAQLGGFWYATQLASSPQYLVAAAPALAITSVSLTTEERRDESFDVIHALDVEGDKLLVLGTRRDEKGEVGKDGAIAWKGSLAKQLADLSAVSYDATGPGARAMGRCCGLRLGGVRFLGDGTFVVIPGVQPGVELRDREGKLIRAWDTGSLGIDTDCVALSQEDGWRIQASGEVQRDWINRRRTLDTVLPLPQGIGLVLRWIEKGKPRWALKVLAPDGGIKSWAIPLDAGSDMYHLRGDARQGKIVLVLFEERVSDDRYPAPRLVFASIPEGVDYQGGMGFGF